MLPRPRTPSPSACCGSGCTPCVMDLHQQVELVCMILIFKVTFPGTLDRFKSWKLECLLTQEVDLWEKENQGEKVPYADVAKLQPLNYTEFEVAKSLCGTSTVSRWLKWWRLPRAAGCSRCAWALRKLWATRYRNG